MNPEELSEQTEQAHHRGQKAIGLTTAVTAVLLAVATLLGHRAHTEEIKLQTKVNDQWSFYQAKHQRAHDYAKDAEKEMAANHREMALEFMRVSLDEECGTPAEANCTAPRAKQSAILGSLLAELKTSPSDGAHNPAGLPTSGAAAAGAGREGAATIQERARDMERETDLITRKADRYDAAELFLEISIVLCSISLLAETRLYWRLSFISTAIGICAAGWGAMMPH
ncbi:MAG TPA: DUF4337 domain-containing protein [Candidatus Angelobacter sp.]|nr:DUF4337 domain-containing protein [Candidatus Angelobacter sp.]